jgi:hypothetical protein
MQTKQDPTLHRMRAPPRGLATRASRRAAIGELIVGVRAHRTMKLILTFSVAWVVCLLTLLLSGDFDLWVVPQPGHGDAWLKQRASPAASVAWAVLLGSGFVIAAAILFYGCRGGLRLLERYSRFQRVIDIVVLLATLGAVTAFVIGARYIRPTAKHQRIAEACRTLARSAPTLPDYVIHPDDPEMPEALRAANPVQVVATPQNVIVFVSGEFREYHLSQSRLDTNTWILYGALAKSGQHREILRIHD